MYCNQCEQRAKEVACEKIGVCGKKPGTAQIQDKLVYALRLLAQTSLKADSKGMTDVQVDTFIARTLFKTLTNVNFDDTALQSCLEECVIIRKKIAEKLGCSPQFSPEAIEKAMDDVQNNAWSMNAMSEDVNVNSLMQILLYGTKGVAAYADHAAILGQHDTSVYTFIKKALAAGLPDKQGHVENRTLQDWINLVVECGHANLRAMELLEKGNTEHFGHPEPTQVPLGYKKGKAIVISGHDLLDLYHLLQQTEGKGIFVYTHGEMLPAHGYPKLKAFPHFAGNFGSAWQNQSKEMADFPGAVLFTTNCIQNPGNHGDKIFTTGAVGYPEIEHCPQGDFSKVIEKALSMDGFTEDINKGQVTVGFGRKTLLDAAPTVLDAVKSGALRHIFLVGGCDGAKPGRNYYTEFVEKSPKDTLILTLACGKFRFFDKDLGTLGPFPRLLDLGQCNDAYAAVQVALALAEALDCSVNDLPLSLVLSWYEQKAVSVLLTLLALGIKNIRLGPSLPSFISPDVLQVLIDKWQIQPITTAEEDLNTLLLG